MFGPRKLFFSQNLSALAGLVLAALCLAFLPLSPRNTLQASDPQMKDGYTVAQLDSLFRTRYTTDESPGKGSGWKAFNRFSWFYSQRAYPDGDIPAGARMLAWEEKQQNRQNHDPLDEDWNAIGPSNLAGRILCMAWHPTDANTIYAGSASGGLWKTTDGGATWFPLTDELPSLAVGAIALEPGNPNTIYIGTGEGSFNADAVYGAGVFKSTDGGATWNTTGLSWSQSQSRAINKIVINPSNPQIVYAACNRVVGGIFKSTNGGGAWTQYHAGDVKDLIIHPDSVNVLYSVCGDPWGNSLNGIFRSTDSGVTWTRLSSGLPSATSMGRAQLSMAPSNHQTLYVGISQTISAGAGLYGIYKTVNAGATWTTQATTPNFYAGQGWYNLVIAVHPTSASTLFSSGLDCYKSTDNGVNWTRKTFWNYSPGNSQYAHADHHELIFKPGDPNTILVGTDGGIYKSVNGGDTWVGLNNGLVTYQFYAMGNDVLNASVCYGGTQDNGTNKYTGSNTWTWALGGDGGYCNVDYTNSNIVYAETQRGSHYKSTNAGSSWSSIQSGISGYGEWVTPVAIDPTNPATLYTATTQVYKTTNGGTNWTAISGQLSSYYISTIAVAPSNSQIIYVGLGAGAQVWKTTNGGSNWTNVTTGLPNRYITRVAIDPSNPSIVYVTTSGYASGHVWKSTNGGSTWSNSSTGIPDIPCNAFVIDQNTPTTLYVGSDLGVYESTDGGANWSDFSAGLPNVVVDDLALHPTSGVLRAATHGRGMWETSTGAAQSITVLTPNGGDSWPSGTTQTITWGTGGLGGNVQIQLNRTFPSGGWETIIASTPNDGSYAWTVSGAATSMARVRVTSVETPAATDVSNSEFSITPPVVTVIDPNGGETWVSGTVDTISWMITGTPGTVVVQLNRTYPSANWETIATTSNTSTPITVTGGVSNTVRVRVYLQSTPTVGDSSNSNFSIAVPTVTVLSPNGGETLTPGQPTALRWSSTNMSGTRTVELNRSYSGGQWEVLSSTVTADSLVWTPDQFGGIAARIRVTSNSFPTISDVSNADFTILTPSLAVVSPNGGESLTSGNAYTLRWSRSNLFGLVNVYYNLAHPSGQWLPVQLNVASDTLQWTVPSAVSGAARIRVSSVNVPTLSDESNGNFSIGSGITLISPNGLESWSLNTPATITWTRANAPGNVTVQLNRTYPTGQWELLTTSASGDSFSWNVTGATTTGARVRVFLTDNTSVGDTSNASFNIVLSTLTITTPNGGQIWNTRTYNTIRWTRSNTPGPVSVLVNRQYPTGAWDTLATAVTVDTLRWFIPNDGCSTAVARVKVVWNTQPLIGDTSNANFAIVPQLYLLQPNGNEVLPSGSTYTIRWRRSNSAGSVRILYTRTWPELTWQTLTTSATSDTFQWTVPATLTTQGHIAIYMTNEYGITDTSAAAFSIVPSSSITVTSPNGGEQWAIGVPQTITFVRNNATGAASVHLNRNYPDGAWELLNGNVTASSLAWTPSGAASSNARIRVYLNSNPALRDSSNNNFTLGSGASSLVVNVPNGGETWNVGSAQTITFTRNNASGNATVEINRSYPSPSWEVLSTTVSGSSYAWTVSGNTSATARVRVSLTAIPAVGDTSNQNFTIASQPSIVVNVPNGGESWNVGSVQTITFTRNNATGNATIEINRTYPSPTWEVLSTTVNGSSYAWTVSGNTSTTARVRVSLTATPAVGDTSNQNFTIASQPSIVVNIPNGGESWNVGSAQTITFTRNNASGNATVEINRTYPSPSWEVLSTTVSGSTYAWTVSGNTSTTARVRVSLTATPAVGDTSNQNFTIASQPSITVTAPNGNESWNIGSVQTITFTRNNASGNATVMVNRTYPSLSWESLSTTVSGNSYAWTVTGPASATTRVRVFLSATPAVGDTSNQNFSITNAPTLSLTTPNGGETWVIGTSQVARFTRSNASGNVAVLLNRSYPGGSWDTLSTTVTADTFAWTVTGAATSSARMRIYLTSSPSVTDSSANNFSIVSPALTVTAPNGNESWNIGTAQTISFTRSNATGPVTVEVNCSYPSATWELISNNVTGSSVSWTPTGAGTTTARVRATLNSMPSVGDTSNANFALVAPSIVLIAPNGNDTLSTGVSYTISWTRINAGGAASVAIDRNYPSGTWEPITSSTTASSYAWNVSGPVTNNARIRVSLNSNPSVGDTSAANFRIVTPTLTLVVPNGGEDYTLGGPMTIRWTRSFANGNVSVLLNRTYPSGPWTTLTTTALGDSFVWTATGSATTTARIRVQLTANAGVNDFSANNFTLVQRTLALTTHNSGGIYYTGSQSQVNFTRSNATGNVTIQLNRAYPSGPWETLTSTVSTSSYTWNITGNISVSARLRIFLNSETFVGDTSNISFSIANPSVTLNVPNGGEAWPVDSVRTITWTKNGISENVRVELNRNHPSGTWEVLSNSAPGTSYFWTVTSPVTSTARVRVTAITGGQSDASNSDFSIVSSQLTVLSPNGNESVNIGDPLSIRWARNGASGNVQVYLNRTYPGPTWELLGSSLVDSLVWSSTGSSSTTARIRVQLQSNPNIADTSNANFALVAPSIQISSPNGGEQLVQGATHTVTWSSTGNSNPKRILLNTSYPSGGWTTIASDLSGTSYVWNVTQAPTTQARIVVQDQVSPSVGDTSNTNFSILASDLTVISPNGGEQWMIALTHYITFSRANHPWPVRIELNRNYPSASWETLASGYTGSQFLWFTLWPYSTNARIRVVSETYPSIGDTSDASFRIVPFGITVVTPSEPDTIVVGDTMSVTWIRQDVGEVDVLLDRDFPSGQWEILAQNLNSDTFNWVATPPISTDCRMKIRVHADTSISDTTEEFAIDMPRVTVTAPVGGETYSENDAVTIAWTRHLVSDAVRVELNRDYPGGTWEVIADNVSGNSTVWNASGDTTQHARVRVSLVSQPTIGDTCNADFRIVYPGLHVMLPNGNDTLVVGNTKVIRWERADASGQVRVELNRNHPDGSWEVLATAVTVDTFAWTVTGSATTNARFRVTLVFNTNITDVSDANSWITPPLLQLIAPVAGDSMILGTSTDFAWSRVGVSPDVNVYVKRNYPSGQWELLAQHVTTDSWNWTVSGTPSEVARFRVLSAVSGSIGDTTDGAVHIGQPQLTWTTPSGAQNYRTGEVVTLAWTRSYAAGDVRVELSRQGTGGPWEELGVTLGNSFDWTVTGPATAIARLRITLVDLPWVAAMTSFNSTIVIPSLSIAAPTGSGPYAVGRNLTIWWERTNVPEPVNVYVDRAAIGSAVEILREGVAGDSIHWTATGPETENAAIVLRTQSGLFVETQSSTFSLAQPALTLANPVGGENFVEGATLSVRWNRTVVTDPVRVELNRDYPTGSWTVLSSAVADTFFNWTVSGPTTYNARLRITSTVDGLLADSLESAISLLVPTLELTSSLEGARLPIGFATQVTWSRIAVDGGINIGVSRDGGLNYEAVATNISGDTYTLTPEGDASENARLRISSAINPSVLATSGAFTLAQPTLSLISPLGGDSTALGTSLVVQWSETDHPAAVNVELNRNYPLGSWETLVSTVDGDSFVWMAEGSEALNARIRVASAVSELWNSQSTADFALLNPALQITAPVGGSPLFVGEPALIEWQRTLLTGNVRVLLRREGGNTSILAQGLPGTSLNTNIPGPPVALSWIIVEDMSDPSRADSIQLLGAFQRRLAILGMEDSTRCVIGREVTISWLREYADGDVSVQISLNYPLSGWETIAVTNGDSVTFTPEGAETESLAMRVIWNTNSQIGDSIVGVRVVNPALQLAEFVETEYRIGSPLTVSWNNHEVDGAVLLELDRNYPSGNWESLYTGEDSSFTWIVSGIETDAARLRILSADYSQAADTSGNLLTFYRPSLTLTVNALSDTLYIGHELEFELSFEHNEVPADIAIQREPEGEWETILNAVGEGLHAWTISGTASAQVRFRAFVPDDADLDQTSDPYTLLAPSLQFMNTPELPVMVGDTVGIEWQALGVAGPASVWLLRDEQPAELLVASSVEATLTWVVTPPRADQAWLVVTADNAPEFSDTSVAFAIRVPELVFTNPVESGTDTVGTPFTVSWTWIDDSAAVRLEVSHSGLTGPWLLLSDVNTQLAHTWMLTGPETVDMRYRISSVTDSTVFAISAARQVVERQLALDAIGGTWYVGEERWIRWTRANYGGTVNVEVQRMDRSQPWEAIAESGSDSILWTVTGPVTDFAMLRLVAAENPDVFDTTDAPLRIAEPHVTVVAPNGGELLEEGQDIRLRWIGEGFEGGVAIGLWRGEPVNQFDTLFIETENDSDEIWTITGPGATGCYLVVFAVGNLALHDTSDAPFTIQAIDAAADDLGELPREFSLASPYPNPFNSRATLQFALPKNGHVRLVIFDILGREVETLVNEPRAAGYHTLSWEAARFSSGIYFVRMTSDDFVMTRKLHLIK